MGPCDLPLQVPRIRVPDSALTFVTARTLSFFVLIPVAFHVLPVALPACFDLSLVAVSGMRV